VKQPREDVDNSACIDCEALCYVTDVCRNFSTYSEYLLKSYFYL
jgi:hypothetical protein